MIQQNSPFPGGKPALHFAMRCSRVRVATRGAPSRVRRPGTALPDRSLQTTDSWSTGARSTCQAPSSLWRTPNGCRCSTSLPTNGPPSRCRCGSPSWRRRVGLPFGIAIAWLLARKSFWGKTLFDGIIHLPLVLPPVVTGYLLLITFGRRGLLGAFLADHLGIVLSFRWTGAALACGIMGFPLLVRADQARRSRRSINTSSRLPRRSAPAALRILPP